MTYNLISVVVGRGFHTLQSVIETQEATTDKGTKYVRAIRILILNDQMQLAILRCPHHDTIGLPGGVVRTKNPDVSLYDNDMEAAIYFVKQQVGHHNSLPTEGHWEDSERGYNETSPGFH